MSNGNGKTTKVSQKNKLITLSSNITAAINQKPGSGNNFGKRFHIIEDEQGVRVPVMEDSRKVLHYIKEEKIVTEIMAYCHKVMRGAGIFSIDYEDAVKIMKFWKGYTDPLDESKIKIVSNKSDDGLCWHRLPWDINGTHGETPTFDELLSRIDANVEAFMKFIASILVNDSDNQTYLWIHGEGRNGKGRLINFLRKVMGPAFSSQTAPDRSEMRFFNAGLLGKRLVVFPDCDNYNFVTSGLFKSLTGGDAQRIERKGKDVFTTILNTKFVFSSNDRPNISGSVADMRRAIYIQISEIDESKIIPTNTYDRQLWNEGPAFLSKCLALYKRDHPDHSPIMPDTESTQDLVDDNETQEWDFFNKYLTFDEKGMLSPSDLHDLFRQHRWHDLKQRRFVTFLLRHNVIRVKKVINGIRERPFSGVRLNETTKTTMAQY